MPEPGPLAELLAEARALQPEVVDLRRRIHAEPELGLDLPGTRAKVLAAIADLDLEVELHERTSGIVATMRGARPGRTILLRGDMDALPLSETNELPYRSKRDGAMHACGHDAHTAMLAGAARILAAHRASFAGQVVFMFQPGEEGFGGARVMLEEGLLERSPGVDAAFAIHIAPWLHPGTIGTRPGAMLASADVFSVTVRGRGGHASMPHQCRDPVPVAATIIQSLQTFVTREVPASDPVVVTVTRLRAGTTDNVIPERVEMLGTIRSLSEGSRELAHEGIHRVVHGVASAHGVEAEVGLEPGYPVTHNDPAFEGWLRGVAGDLLGPQGVVPFPSPVMGAEDFSYVLNEVPGAMVFLGVRPPGEADPAPCHSDRMRLDEDGLAYGTALHAAVALRFLDRA